MSKDRLNVVLHGSFVGDNFGDTLLLMVFVQRLKSTDESFDISISTASDHAASRTTALPTGRVRALLRADYVVLCGGGYLGEPPTNTTYWSLRLWFRHLAFMVGLRLLGRRYSAIAVGFGPLTRWWTRIPAVWVLNSADVVTFRDVESLRAYQDSGGTNANALVTADAVVSLSTNELAELADIPPKPPTKRILLVHLPGSGATEKVRRFALEQIRDLVRDSEYEIRLVSDSMENCVPRWFQWKPDPSWEEVTFKGPEQLLAEVANASHIITSKLHLGICASVLGKKVLSLYDHPKTPRFYRQLGRDDVFLALETNNSVRIRGELEKFLRNSIDPILVSPHLRAQAMRNWELAAKAIRTNLEV